MLSPGETRASALRCAASFIAKPSPSRLSTTWFVRVENILVIFQSMFEAGRWPISLYPGWPRFALTFVVPVAFAITVPAEALTGRLSVTTILVTLGSVVLLFLLSRTVWNVGLRQYSGTSA